MTTSNKRPLGITILAILFLLNATTSLVGALYRTLSGSSLVLGRALLLPKYFLVALDIFSVFFGIWTIVLVIGLWKMRRWSWIGTILTQVIGSLITVLGGIFVWQRGDFLLQSYIFALIASLMFTAVIVCYFLRPNIKAAFYVD
jgi:hypothetical protein